MILDNKELIDHAQAVALTYVEAFTLRRNDLDEVLAEYPACADRVHRAQRRITLQRAMLKYLAQVKGNSGPKSVALKYLARGYVEVKDIYTTEQKIDQLHQLLLGDETETRATISDPEGKDGNAKRRTRRASFSKEGGGVTPLASGGGGGGGSDPLLRRQLDDLSGQVQQIMSSQSAMADAIKRLADQVERLQPAGS